VYYIMLNFTAIGKYRSPDGTKNRKFNQFCNYCGARVTSRAIRTKFDVLE